MKYEVEMKFLVQDIEPLRAVVAELGGAWSAPIEQVDTYFRHPSRDFATTDEALRIRRVGQSCCITYKGPKIDSHTKTRREIELPLPDRAATYDEFCELLEALGFQRVADVRKQRRLADVRWQEREVEVALDDVERVGVYVELEIQADASTLDQARSCVTDLAQRMGLSVHERRSYLELMLQSGASRE